MLRFWILLTVTAVALILPTNSPGYAEDQRPNFVVIMLDDLGYSDLGCFGGEIQTPQMDSLAAGGVRLTRFYNCGRCCPTRASLMTGKYPHQVGLARNGRSLSTTAPTIAELLKQAGYQTAMAGKWHLSETPVLEQDHLKWVNHQFDPGRPFGPLETYPVNRGFDEFYGIIWGVINYFDPFSLVEGSQAVPEVPAGYYITDAITEKAETYLKVMSGEDKPFFLYVAHCAPHWPLHALPENIQKYRDVYKEGWHVLRDRRYQKLVDMKLIDPQTHPLPELHGRGPDWEQLSESQRAWESSLMAVHAAMIDRVDQGVGRLLKTLKETGEFDNTVIILLADNGASPERLTQPGYDRPSETRGGVPIRYTGFQTPGGETTYGGIGPWWANAANTPFRFWKKESFEGGIHTPCVIHWPSGLKLAAGSTIDELGHVMDVLPTCLDLAGGLKLTEELGISGQSLGPILRGERQLVTQPSQRDLYFEHEGGRALISGEWKISALPNRDWELFKIQHDRTETSNVAGRHPEVVRNLHEHWLEWAREVGVPQDVIQKAAGRQ